MTDADDMMPGRWAGEPPADVPMAEVFCRDCGASLGYQPAGLVLTDEQHAELWEHVRCPERIARALELSREDLAGVIATAAAAIMAAYPDFPHNVIGDPREEPVRRMRAKIAAELVAERIGQAGFTMTNRYRLRRPPANGWDSWAGDGVGP